MRCIALTMWRKAWAMQRIAPTKEIRGGPMGGQKVPLNRGL
jgi:hypothetical protein